MEKLFSEFNGATANDWKNQIIKDLKGTEFEKLIWHTQNGFGVKPFYTSEDIGEKNAPVFQESDWDIGEQITVTDEKKDNQRALKALQGGASGLVFYIHEKIDTKVLLQNISLEHIYTQFFIGFEALHLLEDLKEFYQKKNVYEEKQKCFIVLDPLCWLAFNGKWNANAEQDLSAIEKLPNISVNVSLYQEAGANAVTELAVGLAHTNEYFTYFSEKKLLQDKTLHFTFSVGGDFYTEIAKLRAFRKLVALLQEQYNTNFSIHIHAQTTQLNKSNLDAYNNMLRTTTEAMSAVIGGCNSLCVLPYDETFHASSDFSARIARNQQHILKEESYLHKVADMASGSYYIETLTEEIAAKAWDEFKTLESKGGFIKCLENTFIQSQIKEQTDVLIQQFKEEKLVLVGVNKFQNKSEVKIENVKAAVISSEVEKRSSAKTKSIKPIRLSDYLE